LISFAASALRCARLRTSLATTAKPRPWSPARAASTAALSARMLVWNAMPSMMLVISAILRDEFEIPCIVRTTSPTTLPPRPATEEACCTSLLALVAFSALWVTVAVSCSSALEVSSRLEA
jgi:hypothetical protein